MALITDRFLIKSHIYNEADLRPYGYSCSGGLKGHHPLGNFVAATLKSSKDFLMNLIMTMRFMKNTLNFQVLLQQSCLVDDGLKAHHPLGNFVVATL